MGARLVSVFMGTPEFAVPVLRALAGASELRLVVTQPDRPVGRGRRLEAPPVKSAAAELGIDVIQPERVKGRAFAREIARCEPDVLVTAAYGRILGRRLLATPHRGCLNVHASLLPRWRGAAPINWAIASGDTRSGVSIVRMVEELDAGPVYRAAEVDIEPDETAGELAARLAELGARTLVEVLERLGEADPTPQDEAAVSWAPMLKKSDGLIDWNRTAGQLHDHVRGMHPWPCAATFLDEQQLKIHRARILSPEGERGAPGAVVRHTPEGLDVACGAGVLRLLEVQLPGRKRLDAQQFRAGRQIPAGAVLRGAG